MENIQEVNLHIEGLVFPVKKDVLCEHSDYFRAMFSGNYIEKEQQNITIDVVDANSMNIILRYMDLGLIDLSEHTSTEIVNLAIASNFLQITKLIKHIGYYLDLQLTPSNCMKFMAIAEQFLYSKLEHLSAAFGLLAFKRMKPEYILTIEKLFWYLSHPYLDTDREIDVFRFGFDWISQTETSGDALLAILGCLDVKRITSDDLKQMSILTKDYENCLAVKVINCLEWLCNNEDISIETITMKKAILCETFTERVYTETYNIVKESKERKLKYTSVVPMWNLKDSKIEPAPHFMYTYTEEKGFEKWLHVAEQNLWGWNVVAWQGTKLVVVCGENGRGTDSFMQNVRVYNTLKKEWINHEVRLPPRRHGGVAVLDDSLYIAGGIGALGEVLSTVTVYNLRKCTHRNIAKLPVCIDCPSLCVHKGSIYAACFENIYVYKDLGQRDWWTRILSAEMFDRIVSLNDHIYCANNSSTNLRRFQPGCNTVELITNFINPPVAICDFRTHILVFTRPEDYLQELTVEEYWDHNMDKILKGILNFSEITINDVPGACTLVMDLPPLHVELSMCHRKYLSMYSNVCYN